MQEGCECNGEEHCAENLLVFINNTAITFGLSHTIKMLFNSCLLINSRPNANEIPEECHNISTSEALKLVAVCLIGLHSYYLLHEMKMATFL
jgi:hypothetical protein